MTIRDDDKKPVDQGIIDAKPYVEPEFLVEAVDAGPAPSAPQSNEPPIPAGHSRFYCSKCRTPYDLPNQATSWRCANCLEFNSITPGECPWCTIL